MEVVVVVLIFVLLIPDCLSDLFRLAAPYCGAAGLFCRNRASCCCALLASQRPKIPDLDEEFSWSIAILRDIDEFSCSCTYLSSVAGACGAASSLAAVAGEVTDEEVAGEEIDKDIADEDERVDKDDDTLFQTTTFQSSSLWISFGAIKMSLLIEYTSQEI